jgi:hypothetical protein
MSDRFGRYWLVTANNGNEERKYPGLAVEFSGFRTNNTQPNELELTIYNLTEEDQLFCTTKHVNIKLDAGFKDKHGLVFRGSVQFGHTERDGAGNSCTKITLRDGEIQWRNIFINETFPKGTDQAKVIEKLFKKLTGLPENIEAQFQEINKGLQGQKDIAPVLLFPKTKADSKRTRGSRGVPPVPEQVKKKQQQLEKQREKAEVVKSERARLESDAAFKKFNVFLSSFGLAAKWDLQTLSVIPATFAFGGDVPLIAYGTGLIGNVEPVIDSTRKNHQTQKFQNGWRFACQIDPDVEPGCLVVLESPIFTGVILVEKIELEGASKGDTWRYMVEGSPYDI